MLVRRKLFSLTGTPIKFEPGPLTSIQLEIQGGPVTLEQSADDKNYFPLIVTGSDGAQTSNPATGTFKCEFSSIYLRATGTANLSIVHSDAQAGWASLLEKTLGMIVGGKVDKASTITTQGLLGGGGPISTGLTLTVPKADTTGAVTGTEDTTVMTPLKSAQQVDQRQVTIDSILDTIAGHIHRRAPLTSGRLDDSLYQDRLRAPYNWVNAAQYVKPGADCTLGLRAAVDATPAGAALFVPRGLYQISNRPHGSVATYIDGGITYYAILAITRQIMLIGEPGTTIQLASDTDTNVGALAFMPAPLLDGGGSPVETVAVFWGMSGIDVIPATQGTGHDALSIVTSTQVTMEMLTIERCWLWGGGGSAIRVFTTSSTTANSTIHQSKIKECKLTGFGSKAILCIDRCPDQLIVEHVGFSGTALGVYSVGGSGTACAKFEDINVRGLAGGCFYLKDHDQVKLRNCQLEQSVAYTGGANAVVYLDNCTGWEIQGSNVNTMGNISTCIGAGNGTRLGKISKCTLNRQTGGIHFYAAANVGAGNIIADDNTFLLGETSELVKVTNASTTPISYPGASLLGANGYKQWPDGLMEQWGLLQGSPAGTVVSFPLAFPLGCDNVQISMVYSPANNMIIAATVTSPTSSGFIPVFRYVTGAAQPDVGGAVPVYWYARGRWK